MYIHNIHLEMWRYLIVLWLLLHGVQAQRCIGWNATQRDALMDVYTALDGPNWTYDDFSPIIWNSTPNYCSWTGVICKSYWQAPDCDLVYGLRLNNYGANGYIPASMGLLPMDFLNLSQNLGLRGQLPANLFQKMQLANLYLWNTSFTGALPDFNTPCGLTQIDLTGTQITSVNLQGCDQLTRFIAPNTPLSVFPGRIPSNTTVIFPKLDTFIGFSALFSEKTLPLTFFCYQPLLQTLNLANNHYTGAIPECMNYAPALITLKLNQNQLTTFELGSAGYVTLQYLDLSNNRISFNFEQSGYTFPVLSVGLFSNNNFTGDYSTNLYCGAATVIKFDGNPVTGDISEFSVEWAMFTLSLLDLRRTNVKPSKADLEYFTLSDTIFVQEGNYLCPALVNSGTVGYQFPLTVYVSPSYYGLDLCSKV